MDQHPVAHSTVSLSEHLPENLQALSTLGASLVGDLGPWVDWPRPQTPYLPDPPTCHALVRGRTTGADGDRCHVEGRRRA